MADFEKKYTNSLKIAKVIHHDLHSGKSVRVACEKIFPELKESREERARREIIDFFTNGIWNDCEVSRVKQTQKYAEWISWLTEQDKHKPVALGELDRLKVEFLEALIRENVANSMFGFGSGTKYYRVVSRDEAIEMVKSLRPKPLWVPTPEQIRALGLAIRFAVHLTVQEIHELEKLKIELEDL